MATKDQWGKQWLEHKAEFEAQTLKKKPNGKVLLVFRKYSGLEKALLACEEKYPSKTGAPKNEKTAKMWGGLVKKFVKQKDSYLKALKKEIDKELDKQGKTVYYKGLKTLEKRLDAFEATLTTRLAGLEAMAKKMSVKEATARTAIKSTLAAVARGKADVASFKTKVARLSDTDIIDKKLMLTINSTMLDGARDASQYIGNYTKLKGTYDIELRDDAEAVKLYKLIRPIGDGKMKLDLNKTDKSRLMKTLKLYTTLLKQAEAWAKG